MRQSLSDMVVVITGASSGIGRATAEHFADQGSTLVLAARREPALHEVAHECQNRGGRVHVVPTDVTDEEAVRKLAREAIASFGRIDVWVNNAAVTLFGRFEETPPDVYRRVVETNFFGYVHGARAVLPYFREQGRGVLINVASVVAYASQPYTSAYVCSKAAIRALSDCLRMELSLDQPHDIHVCTVLPATIDTPLFQHAGNYTGRAVQAMPPVYPAEWVAKTIAKLALNPAREDIVGRAGHLVVRQAVYMPGLWESMGARMVDRNHLQDQPAGPTSGNLLEPMPQFNSVSGGWMTPGGTSMRWVALAGLALAVPALLWWASRGDRTTRQTIGETFAETTERIKETVGRTGRGNGRFLGGLLRSLSATP